MKYLLMTDHDVTSHRLEVTGAFLAGFPDGEGEGAHIHSVQGAVRIRNVTIFPGQLSNWDAIKWGVLGILRLGPMRIAKIRRTLGLRGESRVQ